MTTPADQIAVRCVLMRGGTSKGLYFHEADLPPAGERRDRILKRVMGTPDVMQIDGLGGSRLVTSKVAVIKRSARPDADVDYTFAQIDIETDMINFEGNCGNISAGVGPFAIDEGLVAALEPNTRVRIYNTNTDKLLEALVPVSGGKARVIGDCRIAGVPGSGAEILMNYTKTVGAATGKLLPTGRAIDTLAMSDGSSVDVTLCDVGNPCVFVHASDVGLTGSELPAVIMADQAALSRIHEIAARAVVQIGFAREYEAARSQPWQILLVLVAPPADYVDMTGAAQFARMVDLRARLLFFGKCHESMAGTGSMCTAAASRIVGSVVHRVLNADAEFTPELRIGHPLGIMTVTVKLDATSRNDVEPRFEALGFSRTARRLMDGVVYVPHIDVAETEEPHR